MVYFVCMACQETLKRNAVDKHCLRCRDCWDLVCVDCNKVFSGEAFRSHVTCMSEAERYQGKLYRPKHKGKRSPQEVWMESVYAVNAAPPKSMSADQLKLLKYDNILSGKYKSNKDIGVPAKLYFDQEVNKYCYMWKDGGQFSTKKYEN